MSEGERGAAATAMRLLPFSFISVFAQRFYWPKPPEPAAVGGSHWSNALFIDRHITFFVCEFNFTYKST